MCYYFLGLEMVKPIVYYVVKSFDFTTIHKNDALNALK